MKSIAKPKHLIWFVALPLTLLALTLFGRTGLAPYEHKAWPFALPTLAVAIAALVYGIVHFKKDSFGKVSAIVLCAVSVGLFVGLVLLIPAGEYTAGLLGDLLPLRLLAMLHCTLPVLFSAAVLASVIAPPSKATSLPYLLSLFALPFAWFIVFNLIGGARFESLMIIFPIASGFIGLFLISRAVALHRGKATTEEEQAKRTRVWLVVLQAIFLLFLPLGGLILNVSLHNPFGNFSHPAFFVVPVVNGILLFLPTFADKRLRLARFFLLCASLLYFVYFFVVFLPYLPLGLMGLVFYLLGSFVIAPVPALAVQIVTVIREWKALLPLWNAKRVTAAFLASLLLLPLLLISGTIGDRANFQNALRYLEGSDVAPKGTVNVKQLERTIKNGFSEESFFAGDFLFSERNHDNTPLLSTLYSAFVLQRGKLPARDLNALRRVFAIDKSDIWSNPKARDGLTVNGGKQTVVQLTDITTTTRYDDEVGAYRSTVNLTLNNPTERETSAEYVTLFALPEGAYISDYYLDVGTVRKFGILADERAAMAVYESIVNTRRDPGIIRYADDGRVELRVFPFAKNETRLSGFEVLHATDVSFTIDDRTVTLVAPSAPRTVAFPGGTLLSAAYKASLPQADTRDPVYYFIVDCSAHSDITAQVELIEDYAFMRGIDDARVLFTSYRITETSLDKAADAHIAPAHGFNLALAVRRILLQSDPDTLPVILFTSDNPLDAQLPAHSTRAAARFPESPYYYQLRHDLKLVPLSFGDNAVHAPVKEPIILPALKLDYRYLRDDNGSQIILDATPRKAKYRSSGNPYTDALTLNTILLDDPALNHADALSLLRGSFRAHVLTPQSAFIVVETEEQERQIWDAQKRLMEEDYDSIRASAQKKLAEPPLWVMIPLLAALLGATALKKKLAARGSGCAEKAQGG